MPQALVIPHDERKPIRLQHLNVSDVDAYRQIVGGALEVITLDRPAAGMYLNDEGKLLELPLNPRATVLAWVHNRALRSVGDVIVGTALIVGPPDDHGDDLDVPRDLVELLLHTERYRVHVLPEEARQWHQVGMSFTSWVEAYRYAARFGLIQQAVWDVRVVPELDSRLQESWYQLGLANPWVSSADDPPFTRSSFVGCYSLQELEEQIGHGNWAMGTAFYYRDLCFINQVDGGDEWLTIRHGLAFESMTLEPTIEEGRFASLVTRLLAASKEQCQRLEY